MVILMILPVFSGGCDKGDENSSANNDGPSINYNNSIALPEPSYESDTSIEEVLLARRSIREYKGGALTLKEVGQLLWAAQGITDPSGKRTAPSAGALYPLEIYVVVGNVEGVDAGVYKYRPEPHDLVKVLDGDRRKDLTRVALNQSYISEGAIDIVITAVYERVTRKYGERGVTYTHLEAGHAAQNICLQVVALNLGTVTIGAFEDDGVKKVLELPTDEEPLYIMPVGRTSY
jgi:SagB-type dehydrogenase family enzyme